MATRTPTLAQPRDTLTGEPLRRGSLRLRVTSERLDASAQPDIRQPAETSPHPLRLHTPQVEHGGLGGHCFARDFARYLAHVLPAVIELAYRERRYWWASAYGRRRVEARFIRAYGLEPQGTGAYRYRVALSLASGYRDEAALAEETHKSAYWLQQQRFAAEGYASEPSGYIRVVRPIQRPAHA